MAGSDIAARTLAPIPRTITVRRSVCTPGRRPVPARRPARRHHAVPAGRPSLLRPSSKPANADSPMSWAWSSSLPRMSFPLVLTCCDVTTSPGPRTRPGRKATRRDPSPLRPRPPGQPVNPACHTDDPPRSREGSPPSRPNRIASRAKEGQRLHGREARAAQHHCDAAHRRAQAIRPEGR
jgi:hypothetical protein